MTDTPETAMPEMLLDIDLESVTSANATSPDGNYEITCTDAELGATKKTGDPMITFSFQHKNEAGDTVFTRMWAVLTSQQGKFTLRQMLQAAGMPLTGWQSNLGGVVGTTVPAELRYVDDPQYGPQNQIKRLLVDVK